jgi:hypothetical protein
MDALEMVGHGGNIDKVNNRKRMLGKVHEDYADVAG